MDVLFLGVGEACDSNHGNSSILITTESGTILLDCGFSVPHTFFSICDNPDGLDYIWISHFHGDHFFGLPLLLLRLWEMKRTRPLQLIGQQELAQKVHAALELAYPGFAKKLRFPITFHTIVPGTPLQLKGFHLQAVETIHSQRNYGLLLDDGHHRLYYSGDGRPTKKVSQLINGCDLAIHEAFTLKDSIPSHSSLNGCLQLMKAASIKRLALIHIERKTRELQQDTINHSSMDQVQVFLPVEGDTLTI